jgi:hypothetical protein
MAHGDQAGTNPTLVLSCKAAERIKRNAPVWLCGHYMVAPNRVTPCSPIFGQAVSDAEKDEAVSVRVRGVCRFEATPHVFDHYDPIQLCSGVYGIDEMLFLDHETKEYRTVMMPMNRTGHGDSQTAGTIIGVFRTDTGVFLEVLL